MMIPSDVEMKDMKEEMSDGDSDSESLYDDADLGLQDDVSSQLIAAGPVGLAAAAAIATGRRRKRGYMFETNPAIRRRQQTRLLRRLRATIDEYCVRVGQQAIVICCAPGASKESFRVFGAKPLEDVLKNIRNLVLQDLEIALARQAPNSTHDDPDLFELPPLVIDGIPTPIDKMAQQQLRMFIPHMLKYSTGRGKPGWGREELKPIWWPDDVPWKNIRIDERPESVKSAVSWTHALRQIVKNCYNHHGREDLLPTFDETLENNLPTDDPRFLVDRPTESLSSYTPGSVQTLRYPDGSLGLIQIDAADSPVMAGDEGQETIVDVSSSDAGTLPPNAQILNVSSIQQIGDTNSAVVTLHDGSIHHITTDGRTIQQSCADSAAERFLNPEVDQEYGIEATIDVDGQLVVTGDVSALTNADVGDNVYNMMLPGSRGQMVTLVDGEMLELEQLSKTKRTLNNASRHSSGPSLVQGLSIESREGMKEKDSRILQIDVDTPTFRQSKRRKTHAHLPPDPAKSLSKGPEAPGEIMIENADRSFSVIPSDKIQLIQSDNDADPSLHDGGFHVIEIAPGVQQLGILNNNNNNNNNVVDGETVIDARHALINLRGGEDPGGGLENCGVVGDGVEVSSRSFFGDGRR